MELDRFEIREELGTGASSRVVKAFDKKLGREVAIKLLNAASDEYGVIPDVLREAQSIAQLKQHPGIVTIYDVFTNPPCIVMEYVDGGTLTERLSGQAPSLDWSLNALGQVAAALDFAHKGGLIHRDIKPDNLLVSQSTDEVKIIDFGIAKLTLSQTLHSISAGGEVVGTLRYMAPEQLDARPDIDARADQYSLAIIAYELVTGQRPFRSRTVSSLADEIRRSDPARASSLNPGLNRTVDRVLAQALRKNPKSRFRSCVEFTSSLEQGIAQRKGSMPMAPYLPWAAAGIAVVVLVAGTAYMVSLPEAGPHRVPPPIISPDPPKPVVVPDPPKTPAIPDPPKTPIIPGPRKPVVVDPPKRIIPIDQPQPRPIPISAPKFGLRVTAGASPITSGQRFSEDDPRLLNLQYSVTYSNARQATPVKVLWLLDTDIFADKDFELNRASGTVTLPYRNVATPGSYRVQLLVSGVEKQVVDFVVSPSP